MPDMPPHQTLRLLRILSSKGLDEALMLSQGSLHPAGQSHGGEAEDTNVIIQGGDQIGQPPGIGEHDDGLMKFEILPGIPLDISLAVRLFKTLNAGFESCQILPVIFSAAR